MTDKFSPDGRPLTLEEWAKMVEDPTQKIVQQTTLPDGKWVSTVWLGLDHSFGGPIPIIFETMVFPKHGGFSELDCQRCATRDEAIAGHRQMVEKWTNKNISLQEEIDRS